MHRSSLSFDYVDQRTAHRIHLPLAVFKKPTNDKEYKKLEKILDEMIDVVRGEGTHPLAIAMQIIGENLEEYDNQHCSPLGQGIESVDRVKYLMKKHQLTQGDLASIFGGQANVSKFLSGERSLSMKQISGLKKYFGMSADFFID